MTLLVDTSVWSLAYRRDAPTGSAEVAALRAALIGGEPIATTGIIYAELLRGFVPEHARRTIRTQFDFLEFIEPSRDDYEQAAALSTRCRAEGVQLGLIDALIAHLAISRELTLLTTDRDFEHAARIVPLALWTPPSAVAARGDSGPAAPPAGAETDADDEHDRGDGDHQHEDAGRR